MRKTLIGVLLSIFIVNFQPIYASIKATPGSKCPKLGATQIIKDKKFTCIKSGSKFVWDSGKNISTSTQYSGTIKPFSSCQKAGEIRKSEDKTFICLSLGNLLYWSDGNFTPSPTITPTPSPTITPTPSQSSVPSYSVPSFKEQDLSADGLSLVIRFSGLTVNGTPFNSDLSKVKIYVQGGEFGVPFKDTGKFLESTGTLRIPVTTSSTYFVKLSAVSKSGIESKLSSEQKVTTVAPLRVDVQGPANPTGGTVTPGVGG